MRPDFIQYYLQQLNIRRNNSLTESNSKTYEEMHYMRNKNICRILFVVLFAALWFVTDISKVMLLLGGVASYYFLSPLRFFIVDFRQAGGTRRKKYGY